MGMRWIAAGMVTLVALLAGCDDPAHRAAVQRREDNLRRTAEMLKENEERRPELLANTVQMLEKRYQQDVRRTTEENPEKVRKWFADDVKHWNDRQPEYRKEIDHQLRGNCEGIKKRLPDVIY